MMHWMEGVETSSRSRSCHGYTSISSSRFCKFLQLSDPIHPENWTAFIPSSLPSGTAWPSIAAGGAAE
ncbi:hypothetical protein ACFX2F_023049 [Malus domestica]